MEICTECVTQTLELFIMQYTLYAGFHTEGGALELPPPPSIPPKTLKLSMVIIVVLSILAIQFYMLLDIPMCHQNVV